MFESTTGDHAIDDFDEELIDEDTVRSLFVQLGYPNPSFDAIQQTLQETRRAFMEQRLQLASGQSADLLAQPPMYSGKVRPVDDVMDEVDETASAKPQAVVLGDDAQGYHHPAFSVTGHTASTPGGPARTPISLKAKPQHHASHRQQRSPSRQIRGEKHVRAVDDDAGMRNSVGGRSSASSARPLSRDDPYFKRGKEPVHLQHFEPYLRMVEREASMPPQASPLTRQSSAVAEALQTPAVAQAEQQHRPRRKLSTKSAAVAASTSRSNVIYAFTGEVKHRPNAMQAACAPSTVRRFADPVARGTAMRELWDRDAFLTQKGRKEERWNVRRSMLSWDGR